MRRHVHLHKQRFVHKRHILKALNHKGLFSLHHLLHKGKGVSHQKHITHQHHTIKHSEHTKRPLKFKSLF